MFRPFRAALVVILGVFLAACSSAGASPTLSPSSPAASQAGEPEPTVTMAPSVALATASPSPTVTPSPKATPKPTAAPVPPKPTGVTFRVLRQIETETGYRETFQVTWKTPRSKGMEIRVLGVTECLSAPRDPKPGTFGPCLVPHTSLSASVLKPIAKAPASTGKVTWTWNTIGDCAVGEYIWRADPAPRGETYFAVVLAAYSASGHSVFAIAYPGGWAEPGPGEVFC